MMSIGEAAKTFKVSENMLREWEKKGYLGDVEQIDGKRMYSEDQLERISVIYEEIQKQRKKGFKRTDYRKIDDVVLDKFGGEIVVREPAQAPEQVMNSFIKQMESRDMQLQQSLQAIQGLMQELTVEKPAPILPDTKKQEQQLESLEDNLRRLAGVHEKVVEENAQLRKQIRELKSEKSELETQLAEKTKKKGWFFGR